MNTRPTVDALLSESATASDEFDDASAVIDDAGSLGPFLESLVTKSKEITMLDDNITTPVSSPKLYNYESRYPDDGKYLLPPWVATHPKFDQNVYATVKIDYSSRPADVTSRVDRIIKKYFEIFSNFFPSAVIFLVKFDPKVNKKVNYEKKAKNDDQKIFF